MFNTPNRKGCIQLVHAQAYLKIKSHTCEAMAYLRISFWYLQMNLKNKYLFKKLLKLANKKQKNLIFTMLHFLKKNNKEKHLEISLSKSS